MDFVALNQLQRLNKGSVFNSDFARKPVFAYYSATVASYAAMIDFYGAQERRPMETFSRAANVDGQPTSYSVTSQQEAIQSNYWAGHASSQASSNGFSVGSGFTGLCAHSQTMCLNNIELTAEGIGAFNGATGSISATMAGMGVVLGEEGYRQGIDLLKIAGNILVGEIGDPELSSRASDPLFAFAWSSLAGLSRLTSGANLGNGDIAYNRKTGTLAFLETAGGTNYGYRLHIFKNLPAKLRANAAHLRALLEDAIAGRNGSSYETFDFTWTGSNTVEWHQGTRIVPCDDGSFWLARMMPSSKLELARIYTAAGARAFATAGSITLTTSYGREQGNPYGSRHMVSDNGEMVALYSPYYYYVVGAALFFVPRDSAEVATRFRSHTQADSSSGVSIAPFGGAGFVLGLSSNSDGKVRDGFCVDLDRIELNGQALAYTGFNQVAINGYSTSTNYGGSGFLKVQDMVFETTEWKERD